jgi:hypothetical protein
MYAERHTKSPCLEFGCKSEPLGSARRGGDGKTRAAAFLFGLKTAENRDVFKSRGS